MAFLENPSEEAAFLVECNFSCLSKEQVAALEGWSFVVIDGELKSIPAPPPDAA